ncbi:YihY family inner membrane protein [bacterium]|nr:YihY family inner membrane protein [bacterium]
MREYYNKMRTKYINFIHTDIVEKNMKSRWQKFLRFLALIYIHIKQHNINQYASALAFDLILALLPTFFLAVSLLNLFGNFQDNAITSLMQSINENIIPIPPEKLKIITEAFENQNYKAIGSIGVVTLLIFATNLFLKIETVFNQIWKVSDKRAFVRKFTNFFTFLMLAPILFSISIHFSSEVKSFLSEYTITSAFIAIFSYLMAWFFMIGLFLILFLFLPNTRVLFPSAFWGALFSAIAFSMLKTGFSFYVNQIALKSYENIFGTIAVIPLFFVWIYFTWVVILLGSAISFVFQNYSSLWKNNRKYIFGEKINEDVELITSEKLIEMFYIIAKKYQSGDGSTTLGEISQYFKTDIDVIISILDKWVEKGLIIKVDDSFLSYIPKKPLDTIQLIDITNPFFSRIELEISSEKFQTFLQDYRETRKNLVDKKSVMDVID